MAELDVQNLSLRFGGLTVLEGLSFAVEAGELFALIGPNGAGKTSAFNCISRIYKGEGCIRFRGHDISGLPPRAVAQLGIARTFQHVELFPHMSVLDNIMTGRLLKMSGSFLLEALYWGPAKRQELEHRAVVERIIDFLEIQAIRKTPAGLLT
jgi:branched-chain amino acid transport system ATP-binding protein